MGLDMYLSKRTYVQNWEHNGPEKHVDTTIQIGGRNHPYINTSKISYIIEEVAYWRKANQIHQWFVDNVQDGVDDCQESHVSFEQLRKLYHICVLVADYSKLKDGEIKTGSRFEHNKAGEMVEIPIQVQGKVIEDPSVAQEMLPSSSGFFFGGTDYDEYYLSDITHTIEMLKPEIEAEYENGFYEPEYYYRASW
jgi:hypothetical protein